MTTEHPLIAWYNACENRNREMVDLSEKALERSTVRIGLLTGG
jgi:hypothetical protein